MGADNVRFLAQNGDIVSDDAAFYDPALNGESFAKRTAPDSPLRFQQLKTRHSAGSASTINPFSCTSSPPTPPQTTTKTPQTNSRLSTTTVARSTRAIRLFVRIVHRVWRV
ncbi:hypothetical protein JCM10295v2_002805 [Rhodotorula toruloides]